MRTLTGAQYRKNFFRVICVVYIVLGCACIAAGLFLMYGPAAMTGHPTARLDNSTLSIVGILIFFGFVRIGTAIFNLWRTRSR